jgi:hypothetical protein
MPFPTSPLNGEIAVVNGIRYVYSSGNNSWGRTGSGKYVAATSAPSPANPGDQWYSTNDDILYEYVNDGTSSYWVDTTTPAFSTAGSANVKAQSWGMSAVFGG